MLLLGYSLSKGNASSGSSTQFFVLLVLYEAQNIIDIKARKKSEMILNSMLQIFMEHQCTGYCSVSGHVGG
jgi:hypothetical protein